MSAQAYLQRAADAVRALDVAGIERAARLLVDAIQAGQSFQRVKTLRGEKSARCDFDVAVHALEWKEFLLQQNARGKKREKLTIRLHVFKRREAEAVFVREPAENFLFAGQIQFREHGGVQRRQLPGRDHAFQQLLRRRLLNQWGGHES